jgi:hypothetical protein
MTVIDHKSDTDFKLKITFSLASLVGAATVFLLALEGCAWSALTPNVSRSKSITATNSSCHGITFMKQGRYLHIGSGSVTIDNKGIKTDAQTLEVSYCAPLQVEPEKFRLYSADSKHPYFSRVPLACLAGGPSGGGPVGFIIMPDSLVIERADGSLLEDKKDYKLDYCFDSIERTSSSIAAEGEVVTLHYKVKRKRLDTLVVDRDGKFHLLEGSLSQFAPVPADVPVSTIAVAHVMATSECEALSDDMIMPISGVQPSNSANLATLNECALSKVTAILKSRKNLNLLICGDSVCCGAHASNIQKSYSEVFKKQLSDSTGSPVTMTKICMGGRSSSHLLPSIKRYLQTEHPDLMVIEFVNDLSLSKAEIEKNYVDLFECAADSGTEIIVCLPHLPSPLFYGQPWQKIADKPFFHIVPALALAHNCAIADVAYRWLHSDVEGMQPIWMLADQANHPNDYGHKVYA